MLPVSAGAVWAIGLKDAGRVLSEAVTDADGLCVVDREFASYYIHIDQARIWIMGKI